MWSDAEEGQDGFSVQGGLLHHSSKDDWSDDRDQLVVPQKFRKELVMDLTLEHILELRKQLATKILRNFF